jgi:hypothetical protein
MPVKHIPKKQRKNVVFLISENLSKPSDKKTQMSVLRGILKQDKNPVRVDKLLRSGKVY